MRIDSAVNYSSFMQHYNPLDVRPSPSPSSQQATESQSSVSGVSSVQQTAPASEGTVSKIGESGASVSGRSPYKNTAVQDIEVDFSAGSSGNRLQFGGFQINETSGAKPAAKDPLLQEYLYFVDTPSPEKLVDDSDGTVMKLN